MKRTSILMFLTAVVCLLIPAVTSAQHDWTSFQKPQVTVNNQAGNHPGVALYTQLCQANGFSGIEDFVQNCCLTMAQTIYYSPSEANDHGLQQITYKLTDGGSLSYKGGVPPHIEIGFDVNHIVQFVNNHGNEAAITEVLGVLCHEITHGYQKEPKNAGQYDGNSEFFGEIEGMADLGRLLTGGFNPERFPSQGGSYKHGYTTTAFFYLWLSRTKAQVEADFIRDLNLTAQNMGIWSHEAMCQQLFGQSVSSLWNAYQGEISQYPWTSSNTVRADFTANVTAIQPGQSVQFTNTSTNAISYQWTFNGGSPASSTATHPQVTYAQSGTYTVQLVAYGANNTDTKTKTAYIQVLGGNDDVDITDLQGNVSAQYSDSPTNEGIDKLVDNNGSTKYLTFHANAWVQYEASAVYELSRYTITSANDAPARDPKDWTLKGSNDGNNWSVIDTRSNEDFPNRNQKRSFTVSGAGAFTHYRLEMTHNGVDSYGRYILQLSELELFGKPGTVVLAPVAQFSSNVTAVQSGQSVNFYDQSTNQPTSWQWNFEGGTPASGTSQNPTVSYQTPGSYAVTLTVTNAGGSDSKTVQQYITVSGTQQLENIIAGCGTVSAQYNDSPSYEGIDKLTDGSAYSKFLTFHAAAWVQVDACQAYFVSKYALTSANDVPDRDPKSWVLKGSNDGNNWYTLDTRSNIDFPNRYERREFTFANAQAYQYYRLDMVNNSGSILQVAELELFGYSVGGQLKAKTIEEREPEQAKNALRVYPVPAISTLNIDFTDACTGTVQLFSATGKRVIQKELSSVISVSLPVDHLSAGIYVLVVRTDTERFTKRIVVK